MSDLIVLTGPSCVGKSPLVRALQAHHPDLARRLQPIVLYNDRSPRPGERDGVDYHFRTRKEIRHLDGNDRYFVMEVRGDLQAVDLRDLEDRLRGGDAFFEGNPFVGQALLDVPLPADATRRSAFVSPLSLAELQRLRASALHADLPKVVTDVMRRKLLRRTSRQKPLLGLPDLENTERRASSCYRELQLAGCFDFVLPNHDGEDSENWTAFPCPLGDAGLVLEAFAAFLRGETPDLAERWPEDLLSGG